MPQLQSILRPMGRVSALAVLAAPLVLPTVGCVAIDTRGVIDRHACDDDGDALRLAGALVLLQVVASIAEECLVVVFD